mmetsp:Transcript_22895/g.25520  ORF Transcript_22895/g.25520 Transcript_22895/m.25520 type:complete len:298 (-) Transcript_22895:110-1003(-)|eukprot:CAMPEP_0170787436 /NCGR_PEP_ID=MMETSP0733-20121128/18289_1 /TAXON_ID=186038 /ORGANISM="Fragilariopsis kerguelensis, Strain L26-C5" /LENGTH=297 /DNA_ID=CAMNT_0011133657 /DNA_START=105 /DNA_END=998 /DNA_ORIENTATION=+
MTNFFYSSLTATFLVVSVFTSVMHVTNADLRTQQCTAGEEGLTIKEAGKIHNKIAVKFGERDFPGICVPDTIRPVDGCEDDKRLVAAVASIMKSMFDYTEKDEEFIRTTASNTLQVIKGIDRFENSFEELGKIHCRKWFEQILTSTGPFIPAVDSDDCEVMQGFFVMLDKLNEKSYDEDDMLKKIDKNSLKKLEKKIRKSEISDMAKGILLIATSVNKESDKFWMKQLESEDSRYSRIVKERDDLSANRADKWWKRDAAGAAAGFATGYIAGEGSWQSGVVGGICGGISASLSKSES